jgi:hypothetical protein
MLKHLCFHTFDPAEVIKLGSMVDMVRYANHFIDEIDWPALEITQPYTVNALRCIHVLIALPPPLCDILIKKRSREWQPAQKGQGFLPLSQIFRLPRKRDKFYALFNPPEWWMHIFYSVPPGKSLFFTRLVRHPAMLSRWLFRRYRAASKSRVL